MICSWCKGEIERGEKTTDDGDGGVLHGTMNGCAEDLKERLFGLSVWARERGREHHNLAVEKRDHDELLDQHNALSSAYFRLADEIEKQKS